LGLIERERRDREKDKRQIERKTGEKRETKEKWRERDKREMERYIISKIIILKSPDLCLCGYPFLPYIYRLLLTNRVIVMTST
jgi:hypothetical protein